MSRRNDTVSRARTLRRLMLAPDMALWQMLRNRRLDGWKFRRRAPLDGKIVDFLYPEAALVVEILGAGQHRTRLANRDDALITAGYGIVRVTGHAILTGPADVRSQISNVLRDRREIPGGQMSA
ncbi:MAG: DUF559 domain-containing protein [Pseudomonadota bacterium]